MPVILTRVVVSPRLSNTLPLTVLRTSGSWTAGEWIQGTPTQLSTVGIEAGVSDEEVLQVPEGDRTKGLKKFFTPIQLKGATVGATPTENQTPDQIISSTGEKWQVLTVDNRVVNGFTSAICVRLKGA